MCGSWRISHRSRRPWAVSRSGRHRLPVPSRRVTIVRVDISDLIAADPYARRLGASLVQASPERVEVEMTVEPQHLDGSGRLSPGVVFSLADCALSLISNATRSAVAVATHVAHVSGNVAGAAVLTAEIQPISDPGASSVAHRALVRADGELVAVFTGTTLAVG